MAMSVMEKEVFRKIKWKLLRDLKELLHCVGAYSGQYKRINCVIDDLRGINPPRRRGKCV